MNILDKIYNNRSTILKSVTGLLFVFLVTMPLYRSGYSIVFMSSIFMYLILTVSYVLFSGPTNFISLAVAAFFGVGIYASAILCKYLPFPLVVLSGAILSFMLALAVGGLTLRLKGIYFTMFTFGLVELIKHLVMYLELGITGTRGRFVLSIGNVKVYYYMLFIFVLLILTMYLLKRSRYGLALESIGQNEEAAAHMGVNVTMVKVLTFAVSALFMGAAGAVMATRWTYIDPGIAFNYFYSFMAVAMAVLGGVGQLYGPIIGSAAFTYLEEILLTKIPEFFMIIFGLILIISMLYMPYGIGGLIQQQIQKWRIKRLGEEHANT